jgi:hypothetical protein
VSDDLLSASSASRVYLPATRCEQLEGDGSPPRKSRVDENGKVPTLVWDFMQHNCHGGSSSDLDKSRSRWALS